MYALSRYWNRVAYAIMKAGRFLIWDYTGKNKKLKGEDALTPYAEALFTRR